MFEAMRHEQDRLLVDRGAATEPLADEEFRIWASNQRVFISSVMDELEVERRSTADRLQALGCEPVLFERFGGREDDAEAAYVHEVTASSIYIGILGRRYGRLLQTRYSATHTEYLAAEEHGLRVAIWAKEVDDREGHEQSFLEEVRAFHTTGIFGTADELLDDVSRRIRRIAAEDLAPWAKLGSIVLRARRIREAAGRIEVVARVRDPGVVAQLEAQRSDRWGRHDAATFTYSGRMRRCSIEDIEVTTTAGTGADVLIALAVSELASDSMSEMSVSSGGRTYTREDLTEIGLREALFGEATPLDDFASHMATIGDPFAPLAGLGLSEEIVRPIAHLLLTEALVGSGRATRIKRFRLGPPIAGRRRFELAWEEPRRFENARTEQRQIEGEVSIGES
jgi:Domain of unknown function (DUF4062)